MFRPHHNNVNTNNKTIGFFEETIMMLPKET